MGKQLANLLLATLAHALIVAKIVYKVFNS